MTSRWLRGACLAFVVAIAGGGVARAGDPPPSPRGAPAPAAAPGKPDVARARLIERVVGALRDRLLDEAVLHALRWLAAHQSADGTWEAAGFDKWCFGQPNPAQRPDGTGQATFDVGVTGLALCAFLAAGFTNQGDHEFATVVRKALASLINQQDPEGCFGPRGAKHRLYNHAIAALAMVEAYGMTESKIFKRSAQKALDYIALTRQPDSIWRHGVKPVDNDASVTSWMMMALRSATLINDYERKKGREPALVVDGKAFDGIKAWLDQVTDPKLGRVGPLERGQGPARPQEPAERFPAEKAEAMTAVGLLARVFLREDPRTSDLMKKGVALCLRVLPRWNRTDGSIDMYYWHYGTLALFQVGGEAWRRWERALQVAVVLSQRRDGNSCGFKGSWDPVDTWGPDGGRVYSTALMALCCTARYRYDRAFPDDAPPSKPEGAAPPAPSVPVTPPAPFPGRAERLEAKLPAGMAYRKSTDPALHDALRWLAAHQSPDGRWEAGDFDKWCDGAKNEGVKPDGAGDPVHDVGVTGLALCAFLGAGYTGRGDHEFKNVVRKGLTYLTEVQDEEGRIGKREGPRYVYNHATAALALVEAYGMTEDAELLLPAQKAIQFIELARNPELGWRYGVKPGDNDTSVTGWMCHVLASARIANEDAVRRGRPQPFPLAAGVADGTQAWLDKMSDPDSGRVGYLSRGRGPDRVPGSEDLHPPQYSESPTAISMFTRLHFLRSVRRGAPLPNALYATEWDLVVKGIELCRIRLPTWTSRTSIDMAYWYFGTLALHQASWDMGPKSARELWPKWSKALLTALLENQRKDGTTCGFKGSWDPLDPWGLIGGRVYSTAICALCLETPYRYPRVLAKSR